MRTSSPTFWALLLFCLCGALFLSGCGQQESSGQDYEVQGGEVENVFRVKGKLNDPVGKGQVDMRRQSNDDGMWYSVSGFTVTQYRNHLGEWIKIGDPQPFNGGSGTFNIDPNATRVTFAGKLDGKAAVVNVKVQPL